MFDLPTSSVASSIIVQWGKFFILGDYSLGVTLDLNTGKDGELWNLSSLQGWLASSSLCTLTSLVCSDNQCSEYVLKGIISHIQSRRPDKNVVRIHCSCQGMVVDDMDGQLKCKKCQIKGMVELTSHDNALKVFKHPVYFICSMIRKFDVRTL